MLTKIYIKYIECKKKIINLFSNVKSKTVSKRAPLKIAQNQSCVCVTTKQKSCRRCGLDHLVELIEILFVLVPLRLMPMTPEPLHRPWTSRDLTLPSLTVSPQPPDKNRGLQG